MTLFHWNIFVTYDASRFVLTVPLHYMEILVSLPMPVIALTLGYKPGRHFRNYGLAVLLLLAYGFLGYSSEVTLDRTKGTATVREFWFYHWSSRTYDLDHVERFYEAGSRATVLEMQFVGGSTRSLTFNDDQGGKQRVAYEANQWLESGGESSE